MKKRSKTFLFTGVPLAMLVFCFAFANAKNEHNRTATTGSKTSKYVKPPTNNVQLGIYIPPSGWANPGGGGIGFWLGGGATLGGSGTFPTATISNPYYNYTTVPAGTYTVFITNPPGYSGPPIRYFQSMNGSSGPFTEISTYGTVTITSGTNYFWADNTGTIAAGIH